MTELDLRELLPPSLARHCEPGGTPLAWDAVLPRMTPSLTRMRFATMDARFIEAVRVTFPAAVPSLKCVVRKPFKWTVLADEVVKYWPDANPPKVITSKNPFVHK